MSEATAWLMDFGTGLAAVGERELLHLVTEPQFFEVPLAPRHCRHVLPWQDRLLPVWDLHGWLAPKSETKSATIAAVVGYQVRRREMPRFGTVILSEPPRRVRVSDEQFCELPQDQPQWRGIAISCFELDDKPVPILDLAAMFSRYIPTPD